jgi:predicted GNAT family N-acyltransferase
MKVEIQSINSTHVLFAQAFALREKVLRKPLGLSLYNEDTSADAMDITFVATNNQIVVGCLMIKTIDSIRAKPRQMAVAEECQKKGIGSQLMLAAESYFKQKGTKIFTLHARKYAIPFYEKLNYTIESAEFEEVGIPHVLMQKKL